MQIIHRQSDAPDKKPEPVIKYKKPSLTERAIIIAEQLNADYARRHARSVKKRKQLINP